ncbi:hypothetical protein ASE01_19945 [Nocardioides sp. Root190]|uniref:hypothetical protein n=1 Tax=Nocardioides sp. Root190 TaxID=1736488 RepID=UPI0006FEDF3E|nr:hypothetical protein [Nocardioides sp. Root190]KRB73050.1 hypothetical protein ASE01_19945 [Nocardioides sp. Root190]
MSHTHIPRRSGSVGTLRDLGARQVLAPAKSTVKRRQRGSLLPSYVNDDKDRSLPGKARRRARKAARA